MPSRNYNDSDAAHDEESKKKFLSQDGGAAKEKNLDEIKPPFCQMDVLYHYNDGDSEWREAARWVKYEEKVEVGQRWSKPYVATLSLHALFQFRQCIFEGTVLLDLDEKNVTQIARRVVEDIKAKKNLTQDMCNKLVNVLLRPHKHQHRKVTKKTPGATEVPVTPKINGSDGDRGTTKVTIEPPSPEDNRDMTHFSYDGNQSADSMSKYKPNKRFKKKIPKGAGAANILVGEVDFLPEPVMAFVRLADPVLLGDMTEVEVPTRYLVLLIGPPQGHSIWEYEEVGRAAASLLTDKIFSDIADNADSRDDLLLGIDEFIDDLTVLPPSIWDPETRLPPPEKAGGSTKADIRARRRLAAREKHVTLPDTIEETEDTAEIEVPKEKEEDDMTLKRTGRLFGGIWLDIKRRYPSYWSDIRDGINIQTFAAVIFLYFACITPIVTFGGLLGKATDNYLGVTESIVSGCICGLVYHIFSGQPLTIMGATGPLLVFEGILFTVCKDYGMDFLTFRFWTGAWCAIILLVIVMFDLSALVRYITRFTEECFSVLISFIFIYEAINKLLGLDKTHPISVNPDPDKTCHCTIPDCSKVTEDQIVNGTGCLNASVTIEHINSTYGLHKDCINYKNEIQVITGCIYESDCLEYGGNLTGTACFDKSVTHAMPDVFLMSILLFLVVFGVAYTLQSFRHSRFLTQFIRNIVADFAVTIGIVVAVGIDSYVRINTPKLNVPEEVKPSNPNRGWLVNPAGVSAWWVVLLGAVPGLLVTILIFLDQQITAVIVNRKEHKLQKGVGYHLDLFVLAVLVFICSLLGLPWFVAATVRSITHARSLMRQSESSAPGEKPTFLGIREQRLSGICIHILIGVSVFITVILKLIPMPVLYGVFMYMGVMSLRGVQFIQRILIIFMPKKYQPDYIYLRHVRTWRTHLFTLIQFICMVVMWVVKSTKSISIFFPLTILALIAVRKIMGCIFSNHELEFLDDLSPEELRRAKEDAEKKKKAKGGEHLTDYDVDKIELKTVSNSAGVSDFSDHQLSISDKIARTNFWRQMTSTTNEAAST